MVDRSTSNPPAQSFEFHHRLRISRLIVELFREPDQHLDCLGTDHHGQILSAHGGGWSRHASLGLPEGKPKGRSLLKVGGVERRQCFDSGLESRHSLSTASRRRPSPHGGPVRERPCRTLPAPLPPGLHTVAGSVRDRWKSVAGIPLPT